MWGCVCWLLALASNLLCPSRVGAECRLNKMDPTSLCAIFGPVLLRSPLGEAQTLADKSRQRTVVEAVMDFSTDDWAEVDFQVKRSAVARALQTASPASAAAALPQTPSTTPKKKRKSPFKGLFSPKVV
eukprot:m.274741 g.274741  ORF g.274741 m.274741 type:complete len:129 (-) comp19348_c0_seq15:6127-6513(-)